MNNRKPILLIVGVLFYSLSFGQFKTTEDAYAAMIVGVIRYVQWENIEGDFDILLLNQPKVAESIRKYFIGKTSNGKNVNVIEDKNNRADFSGIEVLISGKKAPIQSNLLTVNLDETNAIINFVEEDEKIKMKIRKLPAEKNRLKISNSITSIAQSID